jgi:DNA recombination protein RmuC
VKGVVCFESDILALGDDRHLLGVEMSLTEALSALCCVLSLMAALFALLAYLAGRQTADSLTVVRAGQLLREETEIIRGSMESQSRGLRQELVHLLGKSQEAIFAGFGSLRQGIESQIKDFGGRLDAGVATIDQKTDGIASKLTADMERMRSEAVTNRDSLRALLEQKLDQNLAGHAGAAKTLKDELSDNFLRLGTRVNQSLGESSQVQNERLGSVTTHSLAERKIRAGTGRS